MSMGIPNRKTVKLRYVVNYSVNPGADAPDIMRFKANAIHNPMDLTTATNKPYTLGGAGVDTANPLYYGLWKDLYNHYTVLGSKITVKVIGASGTNTSPAYLAIKSDDDQTLAGVGDGGRTLMLQKDTRYKIFPPRCDVSKGSVKVYRKFSTKKFFNVTDVKDNDDLRALFDQDPGELAYFYVVLGNVIKDASNNDPPEIACNVTIDYIVSFSELKEQALT